MMTVVYCNNVNQPKVYICNSETEAKDKLVEIYCKLLISRLETCRSSFINDDRKYAVIDGKDCLEELFLINAER
jgi:hypothetical protein